MSDYISKKALLDWLDPSTTGMYAQIAERVVSGEFDVTIGERHGRLSRWIRALHADLTVHMETPNAPAETIVDVMIMALEYSLNYCEATGEQAPFAVLDVVKERARQDGKWGQQDHEPELWLGILMEEVGELAQAINETVFDNGETERAKGGYANMRAEAVQVAAVAVALVEALDRRYGDVSLGG